MKILKNAARCRKCGEEIESTHRHDFRWCSCGAIAVDGGTAYLRRCGELQEFEERSVQVEEDFHEFASRTETHLGPFTSPIEAWLLFFEKYTGTVHLGCYRKLLRTWFVTVPLAPGRLLFAATGEGETIFEALRAAVRKFWEIGNREAE